MMRFMAISDYQSLMRPVRSWRRSPTDGSTPCVT